MRVLIAGDTRHIHDAIIHLSTHRNLHVGRVPNAFKAQEILTDGELAVVLLSLMDRADLDHVSAISGRGARVIVVGFDEEKEIRDAAFQAGAAEVLFPPVEPTRLVQAIFALFGRVLRRDMRCPTDLDAVLTLPDGQELPAKVANLSNGGIEVISLTPVELGVVVGVKIKPPAPQPFQSFAYVVGRSDHPKVGAYSLHGRFVGMLSDEHARLAEFINEIAPDSMLPPALSAITELNAQMLVQAEHGELAGLRVPPLTRLEREGLRNPEGSMANIAVARCRAALLASLFKLDPKNFLLPPVAELSAWRKELKDGYDAVGARIKNSESVETRKEYQDLQARIMVSRDQLEWVIQGVKGPGRVKLKVK